MIKLYWVAIYGNMGLLVSHFTDERKYKAAARRAEKDHLAGRLDSYTDGWVDVCLSPKIDE